MTRGERIKAGRKSVGLTQTQLAKEVGKSFSTIQKYELGIAKPPVDVLERLSAVLNIPVQELIPDASIRIKVSPEQVELGHLRQKLSSETITEEEKLRFLELSKGQPTPQEEVAKLGEVLGKLGKAIHDTQTLTFRDEAHKQLDELNGEGVRRAAGYISVLHRDPECNDKVPPTIDGPDVEE